MKSSLAYSRGKQTHHSMGMNPNLNIEDEYVENLLKQIQFLSLETKLIKENHSQSKGAGIMALIDKENLPIVDHLLASGEKYKEMRNQLSIKSNDLMFQNLELEAEQRVLLKKREYHDSRHKKIEKQNLESKARSQVLLKDLEQKTMQAKNKWDLVTKTNDRLRKTIKEKEVELEKLLDDSLIGGILGLALTMKSESEYKLEQADLAVKDTTIAGLHADIKAYEEELSKNIRYIELTEESKQLEKNLQDQEKLLSSLQFKLVEVETTTRLAQSEKEKEIKQRRTIEQELFTTKQLLEEVLKSNELKIDKRRSERVKNSGQIKRLELVVSKLESQLEENRRKADKAEETSNKYSIERKANEDQALRLTTRISELKESLSKLTTGNSQMEVESIGCAKELQTLQRQIMSLKKENDRLNLGVCEIEESYTEQCQRNEFYESNNRLKDELKNVRVQELCGVVENNLDVNKTVGALISKWKDIQNFSRV